MTQYHAESTKRAIEIMTTWCMESDGGPLTAEAMVRIVEDQGRGNDMQGLLDMYFGMMNLTALLLTKSANIAGQSEESILQEIALDSAAFE